MTRKIKINKQTITQDSDCFFVAEIGANHCGSVETAKKLIDMCNLAGVNAVKFTGEVLINAKIAKYKVNMKRIFKKESAVVGLADGTLYSDGKAIYEAENLKVGLFKE